MSDDKTQTNRSKLTLSLDYKILSIIFLITIIFMLLTWKPWLGTVNSNTRTIDVSGSAKIKATPDEFVFYPNYEVKNTDKQAALDELSKKSSDITSKLKSLGVQDEKIKTDTSGYDNIYYSHPESQNNPTYTLRFTITVSSSELAQKVQDYLLTTTPTGGISPQPSFSESKRKKLESEARDAATKEALAKAKQTASNLGFKIGRVKSVQDGTGFGEIIPMKGMTAVDTAASTSQMKIQPGENELNYSITVVYFIK